MMQEPQVVQVYDATPKVSVYEFTPELELEFTDIPIDIFPHYILRTVNKFARDSNVLRRHQYIHTTPCITTYLLLPQDCVDIVAVMRVGTSCCDTVTRVLDKPVCVNCGETYTWFEAPNIIHLDPMPRARCYHIEMSVAPTYDACEVDRVLLTNYYDTIMFGVKSHIYGMTNKPWSSVQRSQECMLLFNNGVHRAAMEVMTHGQRGSFKRKLPKVL